MKNEYIIAGNVSYICLRRKDGQALVTLVDAEDIRKIESVNKKITSDYKKCVDSYYAVIDYTFLHRFLLSAPEGTVVDHINHNTLDNRKCNLRICTYSENAQNRKGAASNSKSGIRGVSYSKVWRKWIAVINKGGKRIYHEGFNTKEEAEMAVILARKKYLSIGQAPKEAQA